MIGTLTQWLSGLPDGRMREQLRAILNPIGDRLSTQCLTTAGLTIKAGASAIVKAATAFYAICNGTLVTKGANTDMAALAGTVTNEAFNVFAFYIDAAGTLTSQMGTEGATLALVGIPPVPEKKACIGLLIINPTGTGNFVGGTTALDDATVVPTALYVNFTSGVDASIKLG